jgi:FKBP-type peptidyl-prolyl cis-trans isomerase SlyD
MTVYENKRWIVFGIILTVLMGPIAVHGESGKGEKAMTVSQGKEVSIEYTLKLEDKTVVDTNVGSEPLTYTQGANEIIPGLEKQLEGMKAGDTKQVEVKPAEGYGEVIQEAFQEVKREQVPENVKIGDLLQGQDPNGQRIQARVTEIKDKTVVLDFNHPLAGKTLYFDVKILKVQEPAK